MKVENMNKSQLENMSDLIARNYKRMGHRSYYKYATPIANRLWEINHNTKY